MWSPVHLKNCIRLPSNNSTKPNLKENRSNPPLSDMTKRHDTPRTDMIKCHKKIKERVMINRLKELRFCKEKTQLQVQMETGIEQALLSKYENGVRIPPTDTLMILADYYGVSMDYIMGRTDNPKVNR
jgi:K+-sensing histidine kinase KdpD